MKHLYESVFSGALMALLVAAPPSHAQTTPQPPTPAEAQAALSQVPAQFTNAQIDQMVAPIALYPDQLLTQVLMASTFPDQLVDAAKWLQDPHNASLQGDDLANALQPLSWDPSVKSLVAFPQIIAMMVNHLDWTQALGTAFANQEVQVFSRVQFLRERALRAGQLQSTPQLAVRQEESDIIIEPTNPDMVYVPVYNPAEVYGEWPDSNYPPIYVPPPPGFYSGPIGAGIAFSPGFGVVAPLWGWGHPDWRRHRVVVDPTRYEHIASQNYIRENRITIQGGDWRRGSPVAFVPDPQRPHPTYQGGEPPKGAVRPSAVFHPGGPGPRPAGEPGRPNPGAPGARPAGQTQPGVRPEEPGPPGGPPRFEEHGPPGGAPHPEERVAPPGGAPHPEERVTPPGGAPHPEERVAPPGGAPHPEEHAAPPGGAPHPEEHAAPPGGPPHPASPPPQAPHPAGPPPQAPHPAGPPPQAHPGPPQGHPGPAKPGEEHNDQQQH